MRNRLKNSLKTILAISLVVILSGCWTHFVPVYPRVPMLPTPEPPEFVLPEEAKPGVSPEMDAALKAVLKISAYSDQLETIIRQYNEYAKTQNSRKVGE